MPWRTYWPALGLALPVGVALGAAFGAALIVTGWGSALALVMTGAVFGGISAACGAAGALLSIRFRRRRENDDLIPAGVMGTAAGGPGARRPGVD